MYSWWWVGLSPETCRVKTFAKNKPQLLHLVGIIFTTDFILVSFSEPSPFYHISHFTFPYCSLPSCSQHTNCPFRLTFSLSALSRLPHLPFSQPAWFIQFFYLPISSTYGLLNFPDNDGGRILWIIGALIKATELWRTTPQFQTRAIYYDWQISYFEIWNTKFWREILIPIIEPQHTISPTMWTRDPIQNA